MNEGVCISKMLVAISWRNLYESKETVCSLQHEDSWIDAFLIAFPEFLPIYEERGNNKATEYGIDVIISRCGKMDACSNMAGINIRTQTRSVLENLFLLYFSSESNFLCGGGL